MAPADLGVPQELCVELIQVGARLASAGLSPGSTGNVSARFGDVLVCSPTGSRLAQLDASQLSVVAMTGELLTGPKPTKETAMHRAMLQADAGLAAVVHLHSTYAVALSCLPEADPCDAVPPLTPYLTMKGGKVRLIGYFTPGDAAIFDPVHAAVRDGHHALLLAHHGSLVAARSLAEAEDIAVELEEAAKITLLTRGMGAVSLPVAAVDELLEIRRSRLGI